ncbi:MAG: CarD family transcriptional regulator [Acidobacteriales bacterium]|nr:CarD family transcriptional regulator [Terriglobales bacterium]
MINGDGNFGIGDKVVYPNHGVGVIEQISSRTLGETVQKVYLLHIKSSGLKVMVPFSNAGAVGLRAVVPPAEVQKILTFLVDGACDAGGDWKNRFKENSDRMRTGELSDVAVVLKNLVMLHHTKPLSFRERKMFDRARYLLVSEMALANNSEEAEIEQMLADAFAKSSLQMPEFPEVAA